MQKKILFLLMIFFLSCINKDKRITPYQLEGMVLIPEGILFQGAISHDVLALPREYQKKKIKIKSFYMDVTEVTNAQFSKFVEETGYITIAERPVEWNELKKGVPLNTPKPHDTLLQPGSLTFTHINTNSKNTIKDHTQWWKWTPGANWRHPSGPNSNIIGKDLYPVVHIAYEDAIAYCNWSGKRLPTEAEWEYAAKGGLIDAIYFWGNNDQLLSQYANTWNGEFPIKNSLEDGYELMAPVKSFLSNNYGLFDMAGNVWEWTSDDYIENKMIQPQTTTLNQITITEKIIKGGSFLCNSSYCGSYRNSSKMNAEIHSSAIHLGFRTVKSLE